MAVLRQRLLLRGIPKAASGKQSKDLSKNSSSACRINNFEEVIVQVQESPVNSTSAKAAVDIALYDLYGHLNKAPVYKLLGGSRKELTTDITISVNEPEEMVRDSLDAVRKGFKTLKIKVGKDSAKDIKRLKQCTGSGGLWRWSAC